MTTVTYLPDYAQHRTPSPVMSCWDRFWFSRTGMTLTEALERIGVRG